MGFLHGLCTWLATWGQIFAVDINPLSLTYVVLGTAPAIGSLVYRFSKGSTRLASYGVLRIIVLAYLAERMVYFAQPELVFPYSGAIGLLVFLWTVSAISSLPEEELPTKETLAAVLLCTLWVMGSAVPLWMQWDVRGDVAATSSSMIGPVAQQERQFNDSGFPTSHEPAPTLMDQGHLNLVTPEHANFIAYTSYAKLPQASRLRITGTPSLNDYRYYFALAPQGLFAQKYLSSRGVPYVATSSLIPNSDGEVVPSLITYGDEWFLDRNTHRIAWKHDPFSRFVSHVFYVDAANPLHPEEWYLRGVPATGWKNVVITHATVVDAVTGAVRTVPRDEFPTTFRQVVPKDIAISRFDAWGQLRFGYWYQWFTGPRLNIYHATSQDQVYEVWGKDGDLYFQIPVQYRNTTSGSNVGYVLFNQRTERATFYLEPSAGVSKLDGMILSDIQRANVDLSIGPSYRLDLFDGLIHGYMTIVEIPDLHGARFKEVAMCEPGARKCAVAEKPEEAIQRLRSELVKDTTGWQPFLAKKVHEVLTLGRSLSVQDSWIANVAEHEGRILHGNAASISYDVQLAEPGTKVDVEYLDSGELLEVETIGLVKN
jgi:hypothetical protein